MDDLTAKLSSLLSSPESLNQIKSLLGSLGVDNNEKSSNSNSKDSSDTQTPDLSAILSLLGGANQNKSEHSNHKHDNEPSNESGGGLDLSAIASLLGGVNKQSEHHGDNRHSDNDESPFGGFDIGSIANITKLMSSYKPDKRYTNLILDLKPLLSDRRREKADEAVKILNLLSLFPVIKESGIFGSIFE